MVLTEIHQDIGAENHSEPTAEGHTVRKIITERATRGRKTVTELATQRDSGHTGIEMVATLGVVGVLGSIVALMITGMTTQAAGSSCDADVAALATAAATYLAVEQSIILPEVGATADRYELALVDAGFLRAASADFDLTLTGTVEVAEGSSC
jgi:type II secretory pathway pseudopilin PulG